MLKTLRGRMILSHILPVSLTVPLMGIVLICIVENQVAHISSPGVLETDLVIQLDRLRFMLAGVVALEIVFGALIGLSLALVMEASLHKAGEDSRLAPLPKNRSGEIAGRKRSRRTPQIWALSRRFPKTRNS